MNRAGKILFAFLSVAGLLISIQLTRIHYLTHTDPSYEALCAVSDRVNCETVALSPYSVWLGVPVSVWGAGAYLLFLLLSLWGLSRRRLHDDWPAGLLFVLSAASVAVSGCLAYLSVFQIDSICLFCNALYLVNLVLLATSVVGLTRRRLSPWGAAGKDLVALIARKRVATVLLLAGAVVAASAVLFWPNYWRTVRDPSSPALPQGFTEEGDPWIGATSPDLTIVEFTDYECPFCRKAHRGVRQVVSENPGRVRLVHKHCPLDLSCNPAVTRPFHQRACELSRFAACAGRQGKFWEANDAIFSALDRESPSAVRLERIAVRLGLDLPRLRSCVSTGETRGEIQRNIEQAAECRVRGTPTYMIGETAYEGMIPREVIEDRLRTQSPMERSKP